MSVFSATRITQLLQWLPAPYLLGPMLEALRISNFAIIDKLEVELGPALNVITGETGAGKSILLGALRMLLGERATSDMVRTGSQRANIEGIFRSKGPAALKWLTENGYDTEADDPGQILLRRDILAEGTSRNYINGRSATVSQLKELGAMLVDMHGQNDHTRLHSPQIQLQVLDSFGDYSSESQNYYQAWTRWKSARQRHDELTSDQGDAQRQRDFLQFQVDEITAAELKPGEDAELESERRRLGSAERLREICSEVCDILHEGERTENPAGVQIASAGRLLQELAQLDPDQQPLAASAESIRFALEDLSERVRDYADDVAGDPQRLDIVEDRLEIIRTMKRKYGPALEDVIATGEKLASQLNDIVNHDSALEEAIQALNQAEAQVLAAGKKLRTARTKAARTFEKHVQDNMRDLELPKAILKIELASTESLSSGGVRPNYSVTGLDTCEFMVSLNAGEAPKPMRKVASGGEISRIMLAIKSVLADRDQVSTLVFDEIDTGISGQAASRVGEKLAHLSASHQVLCITHLPQVAARGDRHLVVEKGTSGDRTVTAVTEVEGEDRTLALARMLSGANVDETTRKFAEKLLVR